MVFLIHTELRCTVNHTSDLQVLSVRQEVRNCSVTYQQSLNGHHNSLAKSLLQRPNYSRRLKRYYPVDRATRFNWHSATPPQTIHNHLWLRLNRRCVSGCIANTQLTVAVSTISECLQTDCSILGDNLKITKFFSFFLGDYKKLLNSFIFWDITKNYLIHFILSGRL